jgi:N-methylhydantoinase B/oxoprolinase/acetone carboxylase alpha subunit
VRIVTRPGTVVDARYPAPVAAGNVETSQRFVDTLLGALAPAFPERIPAASSGTMSNLSFGGLHATARPSRTTRRSPAVRERRRVAPVRTRSTRT